MSPRHPAIRKPYRTLHSPPSSRRPARRMARFKQLRPGGAPERNSSEGEAFPRHSLADLTHRGSPRRPMRRSLTRWGRKRRKTPVQRRAIAGEEHRLHSGPWLQQSQRSVQASAISSASVRLTRTPRGLDSRNVSGQPRTVAAVPPGARSNCPRAIWCDRDAVVWIKVSTLEAAIYTRARARHRQVAFGSLRRPQVSYGCGFGVCAARFFGGHRAAANLCCKRSLGRPQARSPAGGWRALAPSSGGAASFR